MPGLGWACLVSRGMAWPGSAVLGIRWQGLGGYATDYLALQGCGQHRRALPAGAAGHGYRGSESHEQGASNLRSQGHGSLTTGTMGLSLRNRGGCEGHLVKRQRTSRNPQRNLLVNEQGRSARRPRGGRASRPQIHRAMKPWAKRRRKTQLITCLLGCSQVEGSEDGEGRAIRWPSRPSRSCRACRA